ncbi:hypothetical protein [Nitrincola sp. A-D6]|uniref:hypothetical protein n=1 Tax=Nitrincola sp. A-D6 TaxID=1545442 RepID=UPI001362B6EC|nr:hypothetical protein [Nitrincola sp. A-D6]
MLGKVGVGVGLDILIRLRQFKVSNVTFRSEIWMSDKANALLAGAGYFSALDINGN